MNHLNKVEDLIAQVKQGDIFAYETLVSRYRLAALTWARGIVHDAYLAEDIVQEAFLKLKEKIHKLQDDRKFIAWFRMMVHRLAINTIRKASNQSELVMEPLGQLEWQDSDLEEWLDTEDREGMLQSSLRPLSKQARELLMVSAFDEATPEELAIRFGMNKSNVYNILSRAKKRVNEERFQQEITRFIQDKRNSKQRVAGLLPAPNYSSPYSFLSVMIGKALRSTSELEHSHTELLAISGDAFRLNVASGCHWQGIATFDWSYTAYRTMERLGIGGTCFGRPQRTTLTPEQQVHVLSVIQGSIDRGIPAIIRNMKINAFGFVYGYDDDKREILYRGYDNVEQIFSYHQIGRNEQGAVFVLGIKGWVAPLQPVDMVLRSVVDHATGKEPPLEGFAFGLDGYRLWIEAVDNGSLDLHGHAYQVAILAQARQGAINYLNEQTEKSHAPDRKRRLAAAAECYSRVHKSFLRLYPSFPFGYGGSHGGQLNTIRDGLQEAWEAETEGISIIASIHNQN